VRACLKPIKSGAEERYADAVALRDECREFLQGWQIRWSISPISWRGRRPNRCWGMRRRRKLPFPSRVRKKTVIDDMQATGPKGNDMRRRADTGRKSTSTFMQRGFVGEATLKPDRWAVQFSRRIEPVTGKRRWQWAQRVCQDKHMTKQRERGTRDGTEAGRGEARVR